MEKGRNRGDGEGVKRGRGKRDAQLPLFLLPW